MHLENRCYFFSNECVYVTQGKYRVNAQPDIEKPFDVYCDASDIGLGGVFM
jgi:hypothetical protein